MIKTVNMHREYYAECTEWISSAYIDFIKHPAMCSDHYLWPLSQN